MAWVAVDRAVKTLEEWPELEGPLEEWQALRHKIFTEVCEKGYNEKIGAFTQYYGCDQLDASVLMIPLVGFLPPTDPRVISTVEAVEKGLVEDGFVLRYRTADDGAVDGLTGREGAFLACSFWLVDCLHMIGRTDDAEKLFERLLALRNDLGLLSEEYDPVGGPPGRQLPPGLLARVVGELGLPADRARPAWPSGPRRRTGTPGQRLVDHTLACCPTMSRPPRRKRNHVARTRRGEALRPGHRRA